MPIYFETNIKFVFSYFLYAALIYIKEVLFMKTNEENVSRKKEKP